MREQALVHIAFHVTKRDVDGGIVTCYFEMTSMYFDAPESITLRFVNRNGVTLDIPLTLNTGL